MRHSIRRATAIALALGAAGALAGACAGRPPSDSSPLGGGPPPGVTSAPAGIATGLATDPMPPHPDVTPSPTREPMGSMTAKGEKVGPRAGRRTAFTDSVSVRLDSVIGAADRGITKMPIPVAVGLIDFFRGFLGASGDPALRAIATDLDSLRTQITAPTVDARATARLLRRLGRRSQAAAPRSGVLAGRVARLGDQLVEAAGTLTPNAPH